MATVFSYSKNTENKVVSRYKRSNKELYKDVNKDNFTLIITYIYLSLLQYTEVYLHLLITFIFSLYINIRTKYIIYFHKSIGALLSFFAL